MQRDKSLCLKSFPISDEKREGGELSDLESVPSSILQILHPDIIDSQTLHSDGKGAGAFHSASQSKGG